MNNSFDNLINAFAALPTEEKPKEIIKQMKKNIAIYQSLCEKFGYDEVLLLNKKMLVEEKESFSVDDYYDSIYTYLRTLEDISSKFLYNYTGKDNEI